MIIPDTNLLLYVYDSDSPFHPAAAKWWTHLLSNEEPVGLCPVVVFSFLRLATHAKVFERPMKVTEAAARIRSWIERPNVRVLYPGPTHLHTVCELLNATGTGGNLVSDAQIAASALEYGAEIHSADTDFARFPGLRWKNPIAG